MESFIKVLYWRRFFFLKWLCVAAKFINTTNRPCGTIFSTALWWLQVSSSLSRAANDADADKLQQAGSQSSLCFLWALERIQIKTKLSWWFLPRGLFKKQRECKFCLACESTVKTEQFLHCSSGTGWAAERLHWLLVNNWPADKLIRKSWCQTINYRTGVLGGWASLHDAENNDMNGASL